MGLKVSYRPGRGSNEGEIDNAEDFFHELFSEEGHQKYIQIFNTLPDDKKQELIDIF